MRAELEPVSQTLTAPEQRKLADLESIIEKGLQTFVEVGAALSIIRAVKDAVDPVRIGN